MKKVLIVGSYRVNPDSNPDAESEIPEEFKSSCRALGAELARRSCEIYVGTDDPMDADPYIVEGVNEVEAGSNQKHKVIVYNPDDWFRGRLPFSDRWPELGNIAPEYRRVPGPWQNATNHIIRRVDAVVVVGGGVSTLQAGMAAPALGKTPVALTAFGGAAVHVLKAFEQNYPSSASTWSLDSLKQTFKEPDEAKRVADAIEHISRYFPFRHITSFARVCMLIAALALIGAWSWLLVKGAESVKSNAGSVETAVVEPKATGGKEPPKPDDLPSGTLIAQDIGESTMHLIAILVVAASIGTLLRSGMRLLQDQVLRLDDLLSEFIVAVLLAFSLLIIYLSAGLLYEGDALEVTPENFRRTAVSVSALALAGAFLLEKAATQVQKRFGQILER